MSLMFQRPNIFGEVAFYPYKINQSCRFNDNDSPYLYWTPGTNTDLKKRTTSLWVKRCELGAINGLADSVFSATNYEMFRFDANDKLEWLYYPTASWISLCTTQVFRDISSWYHLMFVIDTTEATQADRTKIYINGTRVTAWDRSTSLLSLNGTSLHLFSNPGMSTRIGIGYTGNYLDGYLSDFYNIDGQALTPNDFGQFKNNIWIPKRYTGTYGNNGIYLDFEDENDLGNDVSGNDNDFTSSGLASNDKVLDSPTNNYPILSSINKPITPILSDGNLNFYYAPGAWVTAMGTLSFPSGKWYWELELGSTDFYDLMIGVANEDLSTNPITANTYLGQDVYSWGFYVVSVGKYQKITNTNGVDLLGKTPTAGQIMQVALDVDAGKIWFGVDNTWFDSGNPVTGTNEAYSGLSGVLTPGFSAYLCSGLDNIINFGQLGFTYTPPTGYKALNSNNLPTPTIKNSSTGFDVVTYTGDGDFDDRDISGLSFQPDLVWIKDRSSAYDHSLTDSVRGATKTLFSNNTLAESTNHTHGYVKLFNSNGFTVAYGSTSNQLVNKNTDNYVAWCFRKGVRYGFDIIADVGTGVAHAINHNLGGEPELMFRKSLDSAVHYWCVYHYHAANKTDPETDYGLLNVNNAWQDNNIIWNDTAPTSTQLTVGTSVEINTNGDNYINYLWRSISGFSKVFSYTGNGHADGTVINCGFRPRYILIKRVDVANAWLLHDAARDTYNPSSTYLMADAVNVEYTGTYNIDILSNGFKLRNTNAAWNLSAGKYIGIAYAEQTGKYSNSF